ncbi:MAG: DNA-directed RNA polymerase sigma-70 factor [Thermomicrobiales bacterium]|nr:MAG: DNA-directed RNA polymerase sigma-70 factor [Thermomicrobiales bacterium]
MRDHDPAGEGKLAASPAPASDDDLLDGIQRREEAALAAFYDRYGRLAFALAFRVLGDRGAAEDVVQEAFLNVWKHADRYQRGRGSAQPWLMSIVHNAAVDRRRGRSGRAMSELSLDAANGYAGWRVPEQDDPFLAAARNFDAALVRSLLSALPEEQREAIELAYFGGMSHHEIAERTGQPLGTVKSRLRLGLRKLREALSEHPASALKRDAL